MAQKVITIFTDDLTGKESEDVKTVPFGLDGKSYEIDLNAANHDKLVELLNPYILAGRKTRKAERAAKSRGQAAHDPDYLKKVREWAEGQGHEIKSRGRVPADIKEAYDKAH